MAKGKRFYWIKLKENFMTSDKVDFLMSQKDGSNYVVLYQMLCLKTINTGGEMARSIGEMIIPFDENKIQRDCKYFSIDTIRVALELYKSLGMIYINENNVLQIADFNNMVGNETDYAIQKRKQKENKQISTINTTAIQISKEQSYASGHQVDKEVENFHIDTRDKILDTRDKILDNKDLKKENNSVIENEFEILWNLYPNKKGKTNAYKKYQKAIKDGVTFETIKQGIDNYNYFIKENKTEMQYIKNGSTWFNQECWADDYTVIKKKSFFERIDEL